MSKRRASDPRDTLTQLLMESSPSLLHPYGMKEQDEKLRTPSVALNRSHQVIFVENYKSLDERLDEIKGFKEDDKENSGVEVCRRQKPSLS